MAEQLTVDTAVHFQEHTEDDSVKLEWRKRQREGEREREREREREAVHTPFLCRIG